jgi:transposase
MTTQINGAASRNAVVDDLTSTRMSTHTSARSPRAEVIRTERRRRWPLEQKWAIVAETRLPGASLAGIACEHGIGTGRLYSWRRRLLGVAVSFARIELRGPDAPVAVVPVVPLAGSSGLIEIAPPDGASVRVDARVDERALRRVLKVLREK